MKDTHTLAMEQFAEASTWLERTGGYAHSMTLRDHFAGLAMQSSLLSACTNENSTLAVINKAKTNVEFEDWLSYSSYAMADAMLKERAK